ncbi:MAG: adenosine kinase [Acidimicrobiia bacterium]|nr:adenosine kinase [Acidimicrobiia bacterium]
MPSSKPFDVVGIGNALVDVITTQSDSFLDECALTKGSMMLIDTDQAVSLYAAMGPGVEMSGGSAANTMCGVASFGGRCAYIGKVASDQLGEVFAHDLRATGVRFSGPSAAASVPTGRCLIVVTPDAQRTMSTYLGVSELLGPDDVDEAVVASAQVLYMEGYLWDRPEAMAAYRKAAAAAHSAGSLVSLSLSDSFCVDRHRDAFLDLVASEVDVLFANEAELCALYNTERAADAYAMVAKHCELAAVTLGARGSVVVERGGAVHEVPAHPVAEVVDTTGAGDLFASGFLFGLTRQLPPAECGRLGSVAAAEVISHVGARPTANLAQLAGLG